MADEAAMSGTVGSTVTHRALDGRRYELSGRLDLGGPATSAIGVLVGGRLHELTAGPAGLGADVAAATGVGGFDEELSFQGGTLRIGRTSHYDAGIRLAEQVLLAVWQGRQHCLTLRLYGAGTVEAVALLRTLRITERADGITVRPRPGSGARLADAATLTKQVPGLGLLEVSARTAAHAAALPGWQGVTTTAGELFRDTLGDGSPYFVLAGPDTWTTVLPLADTVVAQVPALAGRLALRAVG